MEKYAVFYEGACSMDDRAIDCMGVAIASEYAFDGVIRLYAEMENPTWSEEKGCLLDETCTYDELKEMIIEQAIANGIDPNCLKFYYDD